MSEKHLYNERIKIECAKKYAFLRTPGISEKRELLYAISKKHPIICTKVTKTSFYKTDLTITYFIFFCNRLCEEKHTIMPAEIAMVVKNVWNLKEEMEVAA